MKASVFVYGTLMRGEANHHILVEVGAQSLGDALTVAPRQLVDLGPYPALLAADAARDPHASRVAGELYEVDEAAFVVLDRFEDCPDVYVRERIMLEHAGVQSTSWTYVLTGEAPSHATLIAGGRYAARRGAGAVRA